MRYLRTVLLILIAFMASSALHAHEATLGVLEFREVRPGAYIGRSLERGTHHVRR